MNEENEVALKRIEAKLASIEEQIKGELYKANLEIKANLDMMKLEFAFAIMSHAKSMAEAKEYLAKIRDLAKEITT